MAEKLTVLDRPARIALRKRFPFLLGLIRSGPAEQCICKLFSQLDARLVESVDTVKLPGVGGGELEQHHELPHVRRVNALKVNGHVGPAALGQGAGGRTLLDVDQLSQRMTAEVSKLLDVLKHGWNGDIRPS
jgi:hypothetical protein